MHFYLESSEVQPNLSNISANRVKYKIINKVFYFLCEVQPNLSIVTTFCLWL